MKISLLNYEAGNLFSLKNAFDFLGYSVEVLSDPLKIMNSSLLVLPGVGHAKFAMDSLQEKGFIVPIQEYVSSGRPFLGICLGMQLLFNYSEEGDTKGLGILAGEVKKFPRQTPKIPHMGWNQLDLKDSELSFRKYLDQQYFYFVHSYYCLPKEEKAIIAYTSYGIKFCSFIQKENITAFQFHPEKSSQTGLILLKKYIESL